MRMRLIGVLAAVLMLAPVAGIAMPTVSAQPTSALVSSTAQKKKSKKATTNKGKKMKKGAKKGKKAGATKGKKGSR